MWCRLVLPVFCRRGGLVYRQEAQAMAKETIRKEVDAQDGRGELLAQLFDPLPTLQERRTRPRPIAIWRIPEIFLDGQDAQARLRHDDGIVNHYRVLQGGSDDGTIKTDRLRPQREINRRQRRDEARPLRSRSPSYPLWSQAVRVLRETSPRQAPQEEVRIIEKREGACEPGSPSCLDADRRKGEGEQRGDRPREAEGDKVRPQQRERGKNREAAQDRPLALPDAAVLHRLQGEMGGSCPRPSTTSGCG
jgi:hypothetical protein